jgi:uncharacterized membrane protein YcaP (DUF421 family)
VITVALMHRMISYFKVRYPKFGVLVDGTPLLLVRKGELQEYVLRRMNMAEEDVMSAARQNDLCDFKEIDYAVLERDGGITVIKRKE